MTNTSTSTVASHELAGTGGRVVLKIGTSSLVTDGRLDPAKVERLRDTVHRGVLAGLSPVLVTSGAIAIGRTCHPALADGAPVAQQVAAALGQAGLYSALHASFADRGLQTGQLLLTPFDLVDPNRHDGVRHTLNTMLALGIVPIVNENDALGVRNNDVLAALLSGFLQADLLLLLTNVPGLYDGNPSHGDAIHIKTVPVLTPELEALAGGAGGDGGTGGMRVKLAACWIATYSGVRTVIADTADEAVLVDAHRGERVGTVFGARQVTGTTPDIGRFWRAFRTPPAGSLRCNSAGLAAVEHGEPLLRNHIAAVHGDFLDGDVVDIAGPDGRPVARGAVRHASVDIESTSDGPLVLGSDYVKIVEEKSCR
jgi:glutamate 5-kinase